MLYRHSSKKIMKLFAIFFWFLAPALFSQTVPQPDPDEALVWNMAEYEADTGAQWKTVRFPTLPGALYTLTSSPDLENWQAVQSFYALGDELELALFEQVPAPVTNSGGENQEPPEEVEPIKHFQFLLSPLSGGGIQVTWTSRDENSSGFTHTQILPATLDPAWDFLPFYTGGYDQFFFFVGMIRNDPIDPVTVTTTTLEPASIDSEAFQRLQLEFGTIQQTVANNYTIAQNSPVPPPPHPNSKSFYRIERTLPDSDGDGLPDYYEHSVQQGDPFNSDQNGNGISDGYDDWDGDGTSNLDEFEGGSDANDPNSIPPLKLTYYTRGFWWAEEGYNGVHTFGTPIPPNDSNWELYQDYIDSESASFDYYEYEGTAGLTALVAHQTFPFPSTIGVPREEWLKGDFFFPEEKAVYQWSDGRMLDFRTAQDSEGNLFDLVAQGMFLQGVLTINNPQQKELKEKVTALVVQRFLPENETNWESESVQYDVLPQANGGPTIEREFVIEKGEVVSEPEEIEHSEFTPIDKGVGNYQILLLPVEIQVRNPSQGTWVTVQELKVAKWEEAWFNNQFKADFIDTFQGEEVDRFRVRINTQVLPEEYRKIYVSSTGQTNAAYNDDPTEITLELDENLYGPSDGFVSKPMILVADAFDNKFNSDNAPEDQTHIAALGSDVEFRIKEPNGDVIGKLPVREEKQVDVTLKLLWDGGDGPSQQVLDNIDADIKVAREIYAQTGIKLNFTIQAIHVDVAGVDLSDGLRLDGPSNAGELAAEGETVLNKYATPNTADIIGLYIDGSIFSGTLTGEPQGIAIWDNEEVRPHSRFPSVYWNDAVSQKYKGTFLVKGARDSKATFSHELGHVLSLLHISDEKVPENRAAPRNVLIHGASYSENYQNDNKRFREFQEDRMQNSQFSKEAAE